MVSLLTAEKVINGEAPPERPIASRSVPVCALGVSPFTSFAVSNTPYDLENPTFATAPLSADVQKLLDINIHNTSLTFRSCKERNAWHSRYQGMRARLASVREVRRHRSFSLFRVTLHEGPTNKAPRRRVKQSSGRPSSLPPHTRILARSSSMKGTLARLLAGMRRPYRHS